MNIIEKYKNFILKYNSQAKNYNTFQWMFGENGYGLYCLIFFLLILIGCFI